MLNTKNLERAVRDTVQLELARKQWTVAGQEGEEGGTGPSAHIAVSPKPCGGSCRPQLPH